MPRCNRHLKSSVDEIESQKYLEPLMCCSKWAQESAMNVGSMVMIPLINLGVEKKQLHIFHRVKSAGKVSNVFLFRSFSASLQKLCKR